MAAADAHTHSHGSNREWNACIQKKNETNTKLISTVPTIFQVEIANIIWIYNNTTVKCVWKEKNAY